MPPSVFVSLYSPSSVADGACYLNYRDFVVQFNATQRTIEVFPLEEHPVALWTSLRASEAHQSTSGLSWHCSAKYHSSSASLPLNVISSVTT